MLQKEKIMMIGQSHGWSYKYMQDLGFHFEDSYINHGILFRLIREIFFRLRLPGKSFFYNRRVICENKLLIIGESLITVDYIAWLHRKCPSCKLILLYSNPVNPRYTPDKFPDEWCEKWTSDKEDAIRYGMHLWEGGGYFRQWSVERLEPVYDVFFVGKDKNRLNKLRLLENEMNRRGIRTMFYITWERSWQKKQDGIHRPFLPYEDVLSYIGKSRAILHLLDGAQKGITLRIQESLIHKVKLITDDKDLVNYDFYHPNNIFILGKDIMDELRSFLDAPYVEVESEFFQHAYCEDMIETIATASMNQLESSTQTER